MKQLSIAILLTLALLPQTAAAQKAATVREYKKTWTTYPYSDPNPIAVMGKIYPYYRFDRYTDRPIEKEWTVVELENDYIKVVILPEVGGKIWTAIEKSTGRPYIYNNQVIKFRDIAMRGPWTSGGIEANYGIIGHTPNCATPVDYLIRTNEDGSVSCIIGVLDLLTRTPWRLEISLAPDKAYFTTSSFWFNATPLEQPYYTWMNVGIKAAGNLQFVFPGTHALGHGGESSPWPIHSENGRDLSFYEQNNFGSYKSYHVFGRYADFYGGYWHDEDFGMARYSTRDDKPGKKIWIWGLSPQGMIWEKLLTDRDGQYVEVQSGRLFNQAAEQSTNTPFKHRGFAPYATDRWTEFWFPVKGTKGFVKANQLGALNLKQENGEWKIYFSPVQPIDDTLEVFAGAERIYAKRLVLKPLETFVDSIKAKGASAPLRVTLGGQKLVYRTDPQADVLHRPLQMPAGFDWNSVYGLSLQGKEQIRQRHYREARQTLEECLRKDPNYAPALVDLAMVEYRSMKYDRAAELAGQALRIDTYDPAANFYYGLAHLAVGKIVDAKDGFELAAQSIEYRSAAYTELSKIYFLEKDYLKSFDYGEKATDFNRYNLEAWQLLAVIHRLENRREKALAALEQILAFDPLNHFARMEKRLWEKTAQSRQAVGALIRNELPHETWLELAIWYAGLERWKESAEVLALAPRHPEVAYWQAYLKDKLKEGGVEAMLETARGLSPNLVFPFRPETAAVLQWAIARDQGWQPRYYLALIHWGVGEDAKAWELLQACGTKPDYAPFYATRASFAWRVKGDADPLPDAQQAAQIDPREWRYGKFLVDYYTSKQNPQPDRAYEIAQRYFEAAPDNYQLGALYARTLLLTRRYREAGDLLSKIVLLPFEGSTEGRMLYKEAQLMQSLERMRANDYAGARDLIAAARRWPENLGAGKPYPDDVDERLEDWLDAVCAEKLNRPAESRALMERIAAFANRRTGVNTALTALALQKIGRAGEAEKLFAEWKGESSLRQWAMEIYQGKPGSDLALDDVNYRVIREWRARN